MFHKLLIANRGEIACRIIKTCRALGVRTAAVYSEADRDALHVRLADEAHLIGPANPAESYLNIKRLIDTVRECGVDAVHPGYGFLSEQAAFAEACEKAGVIFIGPTPETLRTAGDKIASREEAERVDIPVIPGAVPGGDDPEAWRAEGERLGYPVLVKAAAGGGGRGMRLVASPDEFADALAAARHEARIAFGDDRLYLEKAIPAARHVEVQILGDGEGGALHLGDRECSIQRRHQKVFEESPAPNLSPDLREKILAAAVRLAGKMRYRGAGTVEFLLTAKSLNGSGGFFFLEVNARLQVEHPVTEMVTGLDLVALQLQIAAGGKLPLAQEDVRLSGHAIEARLYAEDPARDFLPQTGTVRALHLSEGEGVRTDTGIEPGTVVTADYDALQAKIIAHDVDRPAAAVRLSAALADLRITGLRTNQAFLTAVSEHPAFRAGTLTTGFLETHADNLTGEIPEAKVEDARLAAALVRYLAAQGGGTKRPRGGEDARPDPWNRPGSWIPGGAA